MEGKKRRRIFYTIEKSLVEKYKAHVDLVGYDSSKLFENILKDFLKKNS